MYVKEKAGGSSVARMSYPMDPEKVLQQTAWIAPALPQVSQFTRHRLGCSPLNSWPRNAPHTWHVSPSHTEPWAPRVPSAKEKPSFPVHTKQMIDSDHFSPRKKYFHTFLSFPTLLLYCRVFTPRNPLRFLQLSHIFAKCPLCEEYAKSGDARAMGLISGSGRPLE